MAGKKKIVAIENATRTASLPPIWRGIMECCTNYMLASSLPLENKPIVPHWRNLKDEYGMQLFLEFVHLQDPDSALVQGHITSNRPCTIEASA